MNKLKQYLKTVQRSQSWFAEQIGTTPTHLGRLLKGESVPSILMAWRIEKHTGGSVTLYDWVPKDEKIAEEKNVKKKPSK